MSDTQDKTPKTEEKKTEEKEAPKSPKPNKTEEKEVAKTTKAKKTEGKEKKAKKDTKAKKADKPKKDTKAKKADKPKKDTKAKKADKPKKDTKTKKTEKPKKTEKTEKKAPAKELNEVEKLVIEAIHAHMTEDKLYVSDQKIRFYVQDYLTGGIPAMYKSRADAAMNKLVASKLILQKRKSFALSAKGKAIEMKKVRKPKDHPVVKKTRIEFSDEE